MTAAHTPTARNILMIRPQKYKRGDGYGAFGPEGDRLAKHWRARGAHVLVLEIDCAIDDEHDPRLPPPNFQAVMNTRYVRLLAAIRTAPAPPDGSAWDTLILPCHGWRTGLQVGIRNTVQSCTKLAAVMRPLFTSSPVVLLAACSAGTGAAEGDRSVADELRDALSALGMEHCRVFAHTTDGHAFENPFVRVFAGDGTRVPITGGAYLVSPKSKPAWPVWSDAMKSEKAHPAGPMRYRFFHMTPAQISIELAERSAARR